MEESSWEKSPFVLNGCFYIDAISCIDQLIDGSGPLAHIMFSVQSSSLPLASSSAWASHGQSPWTSRCHLKYEEICTFLSISVRMEQDEEWSYSPCGPVLMEGWLLCMIGWGLGQRGWMKYSGGPPVFSTSGEVFWGRDKRRQKRVTSRKKCGRRCFLFYSVMTVIFSKQWNENKAG